MVAGADEVAALRGTRPATLKDLLTHPQFSRILAAMTVSSLGDWVGFVAVASLVARIGGSAASASYAVAGLMLARMLPSVLFGPLAGVLADRVDRKKLMIVSDLSRGAMYSAMPFLGELWAIFVLSFVIECFSLLWSPARDAMVPNLVPRRQLTNANSTVLLTTYGTLPLGGIMFTLLAGLGATIGIDYLDSNPEALALWVDAGTFVFSAAMVSRLSVRFTVPRTAKRFDPSQAGRDVLEGIRFLRGHSLTRAITLSIVFAFTGVGAVIALGPVFARQTVGAGPGGWGILVTALGIGMGAGMAVLGWVARIVERELIFPLAMLSAAASLFLLAAMPSIQLAAALTILAGLFVGMTWVTGYTLLQENVADEFRGRTFASLTVMARLGLFSSLAIFPVLAGLIGEHEAFIGAHRIDLSGPRVALWLAGIVVVFGGASARRGLRRHRTSRPFPLSLRPRLSKAPRRGVFIAFEGVEGSGKGTQIRLAREFLESEGFEVLVTREPGGTDLGERLRDVLLAHETGPIDARTEALLFAASRAQHVISVIRPALEEGKIVLCDRYVDSSIAYQGFARGLGEQDILTLNAWATQG
ncbi:MAG: dTMP kinase, partial [Actinobacteria bacterium]|nr:dTMP kinase [Actinomycetota bacterium]